VRAARVSVQRFSGLTCKFPEGISINGFITPNDGNGNNANEGNGYIKLFKLS